MTTLPPFHNGYEEATEEKDIICRAKNTPMRHNRAI